MKKFFSMVLASILLFTLTYTALAVEGEVNLFTQENREEYLSSVAGDGKSLYFISDNGLYRWDKTMKEAQLVSKDIANQAHFSALDYFKSQGEEPEEKATVQALVTAGEKLYGLNLNEGKLYEVIREGENYELNLVLTLQKKLTASSLEDFGMLEVISVVIEGNQLLVLLERWEEGPSLGLELYGFDMETGKEEKIEVKDLTAIAPYKEGKVLALQYNQEEAYKVMEKSGGDENAVLTPMLGIIDIEEKNFEPLVHLPKDRMTGLAYDEQDNSIYMAGGGSIWKWAEGMEFEEVNYIPIPEVWQVTPGFLLEGDLYAALWDNYKTYVRSTDPKNKAQGTLTIEGAYGYEEEVQAFQNLRPEIPLKFKERNWVSRGSISEDLMMGNEEVDIYRTVVQEGQLGLLKGKGYLEDLSGSEVLTKQVEKMYPEIQKALTDDQGRLVAFPGEFSLRSMGYIEPVFEKMNLDIPSTWADLFTLFAWWAEEYGESYNGEFHLSRDSYPKDRPASYDMFEAMVTYYEKNQLAKEGKVRFNTSEFKNLIQAFEGNKKKMDLMVDDDNMDKSMSWSDYPPYLLETHYELTPGGWSTEGATPKIFELTPGEEAAIEGELTVYVVNPYSKNKELAMIFLETIAENFPPKTLVALYPDENEPIEDKNHERWVNELKEEIEELKKMEETAEEEKEREIKEEITWRENSIKSEENNIWRWKISPQSIENYRNLDGKWRVFPDNPLLIGDIVIFKEEQIEKYLKEEITSDQLISQLDQRIEMIEMENQ